jgi:hypothetical protein
LKKVLLADKIKLFGLCPGMAKIVIAKDVKIVRVVVAPDSFKGSLSAVAVAAAMEKGILAVFPAAEVKKVPIADGGEGTVEALVQATGGRVLEEKVAGPLGELLTARWGLLGDGATAAVGCSLPGAARREASRTGSLTRKVAPFWRPSLCASMVPPCISTIARAMASPRPSPPKGLAVERSCSNAVKMRAKSPGSIPMPLSLISAITV